MTDYLQERYERGISGNYNRGDPSGEFSAIPMPVTAAACRLDGILPKSSCFPQNPSFFSHPTPDVLRAAVPVRAREVLSCRLSYIIRTLKPYTFSTRLPPASPTSTMRFCYCLFSFTRARDYLGPSVICFYRHVRTNERFNFTRVKNKKKKRGQKNTKRFFFNYILC